MKKIGSINMNYLREANESPKRDFPKYTTQLMNLANSNAQGTRPSVVGKMSDLFEEYLTEAENPSAEDWKKWYTEKQPEAIERAKARILPQIENLKTAISMIDEALMEEWLEDLLIDKTFNGLYVQKAILKKVSEHYGVPYSLSTSAEESRGIDGYIGDIAVSIKPDTYEYMDRLSEVINDALITYKKKKDSIDVFVETDLTPDNGQ